MSTLVDDAISRARQQVPEVEINSLSTACGLFKVVREKFDEYTDDVARRAAHARTYALENGDAELVERLTGLRKRSCELHADLATLHNSLADPLVDVMQHVPYWSED
jgi:hypothetical protein